MYLLSDKQIDFILNDIRARGIEMEGLQENLLDHVCCIIEQNLEANGDFESFYQKTIATFYKDALWEIEEETLLLLTFKNYYTMKKIMIWSGVVSVFTLTFGIFFKFMHWPGASLLLVSGILGSSLIFLPLLFTLKAKEKQKTKDKWLMGIAAGGVILVSLSFLFKVMHWPYSIELVYASAVLMLFVFLPIYFTTGIRQAETKLNTLTTSMLIIMVYGLLFMMIRTPRASMHAHIASEQEIGSGMEILMNERRLAQDEKDTLSSSLEALSSELDQLCSDFKSDLLRQCFPYDTLTGKHEVSFNHNKNLLMDAFRMDASDTEKLSRLSVLANAYNTEIAKIGNKKLSRIRLTATVLDENGPNLYQLNNGNVITQLTQIQIFLLQNTRSLMAMK